MEIECKICGKKTGLIGASTWYEVKWSSPEGIFQIRNICPKCAFILDEYLNRIVWKYHTKIGKEKLE